MGADRSPAGEPAGDGAQTARDGAQTARDGAQTTRDGAQTARDGAQTTRDGAQTARDGAQTARMICVGSPDGSYASGDRWRGRLATPLHGIAGAGGEPARGPRSGAKAGPDDPPMNGGMHPDQARAWLEHAG